ncbi:hypothetical protein V1264_007216 [Littorina saxatilis]|uniref:Uncharacterized protein n=1 Tax=Littorina saxatilis TaxID=31220 RepID=A0AAN9G3G3_9CAEN
MINTSRNEYGSSTPKTLGYSDKNGLKKTTPDTLPGTTLYSKTIWKSEQIPDEFSTETPIAARASAVTAGRSPVTRRESVIQIDGEENTAAGKSPVKETQTVTQTNTEQTTAGTESLSQTDEEQTTTEKLLVTGAESVIQIYEEGYTTAVKLPITGTESVVQTYEEEQQPSPAEEYEDNSFSKTYDTLERATKADAHFIIGGDMEAGVTPMAPAHNTGHFLREQVVSSVSESFHSSTVHDFVYPVPSKAKMDLFSSTTSDSETGSTIQETATVDATDPQGNAANDDRLPTETVSLGQSLSGNTDTMFEESVGSSPSSNQPNVSSSQQLLTSTLSSSFSEFSEITIFSTITTKKTYLTINTTFEDFLVLTTRDITECFKKDDVDEFHALSGQISFTPDVVNTTLIQDCDAKLTVPDEMILDIQVSLNATSCSSLKLDIFEKGGLSRSLQCSNKYARFKSDSSHVTLSIIFRPRPEQSVDLLLNFTAVLRPRLEVKFTSPTTGYVQSPGWNGKTEYPNNFNDTAEVQVPVNYSVMVSFVEVNIEGHPSCGYDSLTLTFEDKEQANATTKTLVLCNDVDIPKPRVYHTDVMSVRFVTDGYVAISGFRLLFSFHHESQVPEKADTGQWNCTVGHWPSLQHHLGMCNLVSECVGGEDESNCSNFSQGCARGELAIGGRCYVFVVKDRKITWYEAANECLRHQAYLASLNDPDEWNDVTEFMANISTEKIYLGLHKIGANFPNLYQGGLQWTDESVAYYFNVRVPFFIKESHCSYFTSTSSFSQVLHLTQCDENVTDHFLCEKDYSQNLDSSSVFTSEIELQAVDWSRNGSHVTCSAGHVTLNFLACDVKSECWASPLDSPGSACDAPMTPLPPSFACLNGAERVPYTLVCDHRSDCSDNSDESFCVFPSCRLSGKFQCANKQCVLVDERCDEIEHCLDGSDERQCPLFFSFFVTYRDTPMPPAVVNFDMYGTYEIDPIDEAQVNNSEASLCPQTHFQCPGNWTYCMPVFVRCNGVYDCPGREDEVGCDSFTCPGLYRCRASLVCVHATHVCDGVFHCPQRDDELLCDFACPDNCTCLGLAFFCEASFPASQFPELRFLDAEGSGIGPDDLRNNPMLIFLNLAGCRLKYLHHVELPNLRNLDLSRNRLTSIAAEELKGVSKLHVLSLARNPLTTLLVANSDIHVRFPFLKYLDVSQVTSLTLNVTTFSIFPRLSFLNLSGCGVERLVGGGFHTLKHLKYVDLEGCPMVEFPIDVFGGLQDLTEVWADNYKICCPSTLPQEFQLSDCHSPSDEISSCDDLLRSNFYRVLLSLFACLALLGNLGSFVYRVFINRVVSNLGFGAFVTHLCLADFLMGVYLAVIGVADRLYQGNYLWKDMAWKNSAACKVAGFLSLLSSEVSAFIICLITLDRFLVLRFPFSRLYFKKKTAHVACGLAWLVGIILAGIPLLPVTSHWNFYSQNGICIPLPITRNDFAGHDYSFSVIIIVNFVLFLLIAAGQVFIYWSIRTNSMTGGESTKKCNDLAIARRLLTIAVSDFLCWFPIGLLGLLASIGMPIPGEVNVAVAIIILPVNSAINPFLYTLNMLLERRRRARERRLHQMVLSTMVSKQNETAVDRLDDAVYTKREAMDLVNAWLADGLLSPNHLLGVISKENEQRKIGAEPTDEVSQDLSLQKLEGIALDEKEKREDQRRTN